VATGDCFPENLQRFIGQYIVSVEKLEILLLLHGSPDKLWTPQEAFRTIQSSLGSVAQRMKELEAEGFLQAENPEGSAYRFAAKSPELAAGAGALAAAYRERPVKVIEAIFSQSNRQIGRFADAFRLRKDP
jgi:hypothetical protein